MDKRSLMLDLAAGKAGGYVPASFFLHFDEKHHRGQAAVDKHLEYFRATGMDFVKIQYEHPFPAMPDVKKPSDWARTPVLAQDYFAEPLEVVSGIVKSVKKEAVVVVTLYSALMHAGHAAGRDLLTAHLDEDPDATARGLERIAQSILVFVRGCVKAGVDGFYMSTQGGEAGRFKDPSVFAKAIRPNDLRVMGEAQRTCSFNILHVCDYHGEYANLSPYADYPGHIVNCGTRLSTRTIEPAEVAQLFNRPFLGGMDRHGVIVNGSRDDIRREVKKVIDKAPPLFVLGADCTVPSEIPWENLRAAIDAAHES
jgi:uroporphyrinogen decarboxylase